ncbi:MAG: hypothetical protein VBE63_17190 [Lamprobacter sp.]|uniref:hypothetical protein n=1 Tax=Lamprobacter sp. TaxID=3100796 RepID=UPI002B25F0FC|nr:hypothetical protein [Lamprobacter sp.]MEA3641657.1 hypothetical protein [Lamprobacter sp.]
MTDTETNPQPTGPFFSKDLTDETRREEIARQLKGVRWRMTIDGNQPSERVFGFLAHAEFPDGVFFSTRNLGPWAENGKLKPFTIVDVEVKLNFDDAKDRWGFAVAKANCVSIPTDLEFALKKLRHYVSSWQDDGGAELPSLQSACLDIDPDCQSQIDQAMKLGRGDENLLNAFYNLGKRLGKSFATDPVFLEKLKQLNDRRPDLAGQAWTKARNAASAAKRGADAGKRRRQGQPVSKVRAPQQVSAAAAKPLPALGKTELPLAKSTAWHPRDLRALEPQSAWQLLIDETGSEFGAEAGRLSERDRTLGRFVGLLLPATGHGLASLPTGWHAVDQGIDEIDRVVQGILDAPVGVIGITVQQLPQAPGERWAFGVIRLIDLVLRLMPLDGLTRIEVLIEQRGRVFKGGTQWPAVAEQARLRLAEGYPERAQQVDLSIRTITKQDSPYNGYVDALAFVASGSSEHSRACLAASGLSGTCLLGGDAEFLGRMLEWMDRGRTLEGADWTALLATPESEQPGSLVATLLERLGTAAARDTSLWRRYLDHLMGHFDSRNLNLPLLGRQVIWLDRWKPTDQALPPPMRLLWLTAQLGRANHLGQTEQPWLEEMRTLADGLFDEDARLVCRAELNLAVTATNQYDFEQAGRALARWNPPTSSQPQSKLRGLMQKLLGSQPPATGMQADPKATAGLRYWGQVRSSLGQHAAFLGDPALAVHYFDEALASFDQLSDPEMARKEKGQTNTYRAIALMDDPTRDDAVVRQAVEAVIGALPQALDRLAASVSNDDKYAHHLALRWLVHRPDAGLAEQYLAHREDWGTAEGHPWPLIQLYRGMLLHARDADAARELALDGAGIGFADDSGPVVRLIGACCRTIAVGWGAPWPEAAARLDQLASELPLAQPRIDRLRAAQQKPVDPLGLLRDVLPFNFR